jgi:hypothetical protein
LVQIEQLLDKLNKNFRAVELQVQQLVADRLDTRSLRERLVGLDESVSRQDEAVQAVRLQYQRLHSSLQSSSSLSSTQRDEISSSLRSLSAAAASRQARSLPSLAELFRDSQRHHQRVCDAVCAALRQVAAVQTGLSRLTQETETARKIAVSPNENIRVLESLTHLPESYLCFLNEITRRVDWQQRFSSKVAIVNNDLSRWRSQEIDERRK